MIAVVDYGAGNLTSVALAFEALNLAVEITGEPGRILQADRVVFPGVGAARSAMRALAERGLDEAIRRLVRRGTPFLGICLGAQVILEQSEEDGGTPCLGILPGRVLRFRPAEAGVKVPHMGWNSVRFTRNHPLLEGIADGTEFYFVHSYYPQPARTDMSLGDTEYAGTRFASILAHGSLVATQFHPEKSGRFGLRLLRNFAAWTGDDPASEVPPC